MVVVKSLAEYKSTSSEAREVGDKFYFPNKACRRGHIGLRYLSSGCRVCHITRGSSGDLPDKCLVYGVGFNSTPRCGQPTKCRESGKILKCYDIWRRMLQRCYDTKYKLDHPTYSDAVCCEDWKDYQNFARWFYNKSNFKLGFELDKDLLFSGNKLYSPNTCCFLPLELNKTICVSGSVSTYREKDKNFTFRCLGILLGYDKHYLTFAEDVVESRTTRVKCLAEKWKHSLPEYVYKALINFRFMYSLDGTLYRGFY